MDGARHNGHDCGNTFLSCHNHRKYIGDAQFTSNIFSFMNSYQLMVRIAHS